MKKIGKIRKTGLAFTALSVSAALLGTGLACSMPYRAFADSPSARTVETDTMVFDGLTVPTEADYGKTFKVKQASGADLTVTAPDGTDVELGAASEGYYTIAAKQVGNYVVKYAASGDEKAAYSFNVSVSLEEDYFLKVDNNGAGIPTRIKTGDSIKGLPEAHIAYYDENKILRYYPGKVNWQITDSLGEGEEHEHKFGDDVEVKQSGKLYLTYSAQIEDNGTKWFSETFEVNAQSSFEDKRAPSLTVSGITSNISVKRAVTLPIATVSDDYDTNPLVEITVTDPNGDAVKVVDIDRYGYAYQDADKLKNDEYPAVAFDNKDVMTFYPLIAGQYHVKYVAKDDAGNVSSSKSWTMTAGDSVAPVFQEIDDWKIPAKWGLTVTNAEGEIEENDAKAIEIPIPFLVDNKDHMKAKEVEEGEEEDKDLISLYVRITDSDYSRDILVFRNVLAKPAEQEKGDEDEDKESKTTDCNASNEVYDEGKTQTFSQYSDTPFKFDFTKYDRKDKNGDPVDKAGTYTVYYRAQDAAGNRSTRTFTIDLQSEYKDENAPTIDDINVPDYISTADTTFNIPSAVAQDSESSTIHVEYRIYSDNGLEDKDGGRYIVVKGGEAADIETRDDGMYLIIDKDKDYAKELKLVGNMYFCVTATDAVGNVALNSEKAEGAYTIDNYNESSDVVKVIEKSEEKSYTYHGNIEFKTKSVEDGVTSWKSGETILTGQEVNAGGFTIDTTYDMRKYTGFEISVVNAEGAAIETWLETYTTYTEDTAKIYVQNIGFRPTKETAEEEYYYLTIRVFDVNDINSVYVYKFQVEKAQSGGGTVKPAAEIAPDSVGNVNVKYTLHATDDSFAGAENDHEYYHARKIRGWTYSLMGNEFTAKSQSSYSITDGFVDAEKVNDYSDLGEDFLSDGVNGANYSFSITDSEKPVIEVQGVMPKYAKKSTDDNKVYVEIPSVIAYSSNGPANVKIEVTVSGDPVKTEKIEGTNKYKFEGKKDGVYTIRVTATRADAGEASATYTVNIGDVEAPEFTVSGGTSGRKSQGDTFTYGEIKLVGDSLEKDKSTATITKKLYDPSGAEVSGSTVSGSYNSYADKKNNGSTIKLSKSGTYKVVYTVKDSVGNEDPYIVYVTVSASGTSTPTTFTTLSTVLIIIAVVLLAGVIVYVVRFRKVKK
ncbi:MAG: hypothetical protein J1G38_07425 [Clostridiales bacterium]|nr:hypothetical protein [Clostridiales bacterium]